MPQTPGSQYRGRDHTTWC